MSDPRTLLPEVGRELADYRITRRFVDTLGNAIPGAALSELSLTLYEDASKTILNNADHVNILNNGRGTVDNNGKLVILLEPADAPIIDDSVLEEWHVALVEWNYNNGLSTGRAELAFRVRNMALVT